MQGKFKSFIKTILHGLLWLGVFGLVFWGSIGGISAKTKTYIKTPSFSSPDLDHIYNNGDRITINADYAQLGLKVTADLRVVDTDLSAKTPLWDNGDGTYTLKTLPLSGETMIIGSNIAICFTAIDEAGHSAKHYSDYLVTIRMKEVPGGSKLPAPASLTVVEKDSQIQIFWSRIPRAKKIMISFQDPNKIRREIIVSAKYGDAIIRNLENDFTYTFKVAGIDSQGLVGGSKAIQGIPHAKKVEQPKVISGVDTQLAPASIPSLPKIGSGAATTKKVASVSEPSQEVKEESPKSVEIAKNEEPQQDSEKETRNWNRLLLAISILIIAAGAAVGGYYGYEWYLARKEEPLKPGPKSKSRW